MSPNLIFLKKSWPLWYLVQSLSQGGVRAALASGQSWCPAATQEVTWSPSQGQLSPAHLSPRLFSLDKEVMDLRFTAGFFPVQGCHGKHLKSYSRGHLQTDKRRFKKLVKAFFIS